MFSSFEMEKNFHVFLLINFLSIIPSCFAQNKFVINDFDIIVSHYCF